MRSLRYVWAALLLAAPVWGQDPAGVTFTLATAEGRTRFRIGEPIELVLRFQSSVPGKYQVVPFGNSRTVRVPEFDRFTSVPPAVDPLADVYEQSSSEFFKGALPQLTDTPVVVRLYLNEWLSFRQPGSNRISVRTTRLVKSGEGSLAARAIPLESNTIEIEIVAPEAGWAEARFREAVAVLDRPDPAQPPIGQPFDANAYSRSRDEALDAARILRFLETREATPALVRYFVKPRLMAESQLKAGLWATPYRKEVIAGMERAIAAPDAPITLRFTAQLIQLKYAVGIGPTPTSEGLKATDEIERWTREVSQPYLERGKPISTEVWTSLADAVGGKRGEALAVSLETLMDNKTAPAAQLTKRLIENFSALPEASQYAFLTSKWMRIESSSMEPVLLPLAEGGGVLRDAALARLRELNPDAARRITLDRVRRTDISREIYHNDRILLELPDATLPELDEALASAVEQRKIGADLLLARYASPAVYSRVTEYLDKRPYCSAPLFAYLFRVDAPAAAERLARLRAAGPCDLAGLSPNEDLLMSPGLEAQAIRDLADPALPSRIRTAETLLQYGGSADAKRPLMEAMRRWRDAGVQDNLGVESGFVDAVMTGTGWVLSTEQANNVLAACATDSCRERVGWLRSQYQEPVRVASFEALAPLEYAMVGPYRLRSKAQLERKIAQFPKGSRFCVSSDDERHAVDLRQMLEAAGAKVVENR